MEIIVKTEQQKDELRNEHYLYVLKGVKSTDRILQNTAVAKYFNLSSQKYKLRISHRPN
jgi:hypothetical protein